MCHEQIWFYEVTVQAVREGREWQEMVSEAGRPVRGWGTSPEEVMRPGSRQWQEAREMGLIEKFQGWPPISDRQDWEEGPAAWG